MKETGWENSAQGPSRILQQVGSRGVNGCWMAPPALLMASKEIKGPIFLPLLAALISTLKGLRHTRQMRETT